MGLRAYHVLSLCFTTPASGVGVEVQSSHPDQFSIIFLPGPLTLRLYCI